MVYFVVVDENKRNILVIKWPIAAKKAKKENGTLYNLVPMEIPGKFSRFCPGFCKYS